MRYLTTRLPTDDSVSDRDCSVPSRSHLVNPMPLKVESALSGDATIDDPSFQGEDDELEPNFVATEGEQSPGDEHPAPTKEAAPAFCLPQESKAIGTPDTRIAFQCLAEYVPMFPC